VVELYKPSGRPVELGLEPGTYDVRVERARGSLAGKTVVADGARVSLDLRQLGPTALEPVQRRGEIAAPQFALAGRNRLELRTGTWSVRSDDGWSSRIGIPGPSFPIANLHQFFGGLQFTRYVREDLAITLAMDAYLMSESPNRAELLRVGNVEVDGLAVPVGVRWHPMKGEHQQQVKLFIGGAVGPVIAAMNEVFLRSVYPARPVYPALAVYPARPLPVPPGAVEPPLLRETHQTTIGGRIGGGVDIHLARSFSVELGVDYNAMKTLSRSVETGAFGADFTFEQRKTFAGPQITIAAGWLFGNGRASGRTP
jgi:hypothetical protein